MNRLTSVLFICIALCSCAHGQIPASAVEHALADALHAMNVEGSLIAGSLRFEQGSERRELAHTSLLVERALIAGTRLEARLRCRPALACVPFYATADLQLGSGTSRQRSWSAITPRSATRDAAIKPGDRVVFIREISGARILRRAVALQRSNIGQITRIRVIDGRHEVVRGRVLADHVVRSES